jgi:tetratricopeptide (TPR) repeat protein
VLVDASEVAIHAGEYDAAYEHLLKLFGVEDALDAEWNLEDGPLVFAAEELIWLLRERHGAETARALYQATLEIWDASPAAVNWSHGRRGAYHAAMGENELAIAEFGKALEAGAYGGWHLERSPIFAELREDPRFVAIIEEMHARRMAAREELEAETQAALDAQPADST